MNVADGKSIHRRHLRYALITAARNEEEFIGKTLESVITQTVPPEQWVIVDDGSSDRTPDIVAAYAEKRPWIQLLRLPPRRERHFAGKVHAFNAGFEQVKQLPFELLGNLDADVSLQADHFEYLIAKFQEDSRLGVAGTIYTQPGFHSMLDSFEGEESVAGPLQLFRRACFDDIGGYIPNRLGGIDWIAVMTARLKGWKTRSFTERQYHHHRSMGTASRSAVGAMFDYGGKDYFLGGSPLWQLCRVCYRMTKRPYVIGGLALLSGFCWAALRRVERPVDRRLIRFHRNEQMRKLTRILTSLLRLRRIDKFYMQEQESRQSVLESPKG